jgi:hypothetical protein
MKIQITKIATMLILVMGLLASTTFAQNRDGRGFAPVGLYTGFETASGTMKPASGVVYGNTFVLNSYGEWETHHLTISVDYSVNQFVPNNFIVTGGSWSLVIFRDNAYAGTLYGKVSGGSVLLTTNNNGEPSKQTNISLQSTGGLGLFAGKESRDIIGVYEAITDLRSGETSGNTVFAF